MCVCVDKNKANLKLSNASLLTRICLFAATAAKETRKKIPFPKRNLNEHSVTSQMTADLRMRRMTRRRTMTKKPLKKNRRRTEEEAGDKLFSAKMPKKKSTINKWVKIFCPRSSLFLQRKSKEKGRLREKRERRDDH